MKLSVGFCLAFIMTAFASPAVSQSNILVAFDSSLQRDARGGLLLNSLTNLPDGFEVMVTLQSVNGPLLGQIKAFVNKGKIVGGPFTNKGTPHPKGIYIVSITSALPGLQSQNIRKLTGRSGEFLIGAFVNRDKYGNRIETVRI